MTSPKELLEIVNKEIAGISFPADPVNLYNPIRYVLEDGGKRLRPVMALMACEMFSGSYEPALRPAIGLEVFHNFTLLHDDIMDHSDLRRNKPTVHKKWNENTAILSGDAMMIYAYNYFIGTDPVSVLKTFNKAALEVCEGQQFDMDFETLSAVTAEEYIRMISLKTAVLIAASLKIGALCGGASEKDAELMYKFGKNIGLAFQLQDDYLDVFGQTAVFGKIIGNDIVSNKKTYLLIRALELALGQDKTDLENWITRRDFDATEKVAAVTAIYKKLGADLASREKMYEYLRTGIVYLDTVKAEVSRKEPLRTMAADLIDRIR
jgi:geranylgeranyl diphosphate synthase, type II